MIFVKLLKLMNRLESRLYPYSLIYMSPFNTFIS